MATSNSSMAADVQAEAKQAPSESQDTKPAQIDEQQYIRAKLFDGDKSNLRRYADLVVGEDAGYGELLKYELITFFLGGVRGALGLLLRKKLYPLLFNQCGKGVIFGRNLTIRNAKNITLGENVVLDDDCVLDARGAGEEGVVIGDRVILNRGVSVQAKIGPVHVGADSDIGMHSDLHSQGGLYIGRQVVLGGSGKMSGGIFQIDRHTPLAEDGGEGATASEQAEREQTRSTRGPIRLGDKVLVGMGSMFLDGVDVGEGAVIGAGSVVIRSIPAYTVAAGVPAKVLRERTSREAAAVR
ncbi:MAG: acyltransferase [Firmicutes bacterium]|nr:acyltransferase [Bacillota bacterium]